MTLTDTIYSAVGLSYRNGPTFKTGALLVGAEALWRVDDSSMELTRMITISDMAQGTSHDCRFIEEAVEVECSDAILIVFDDGSTYSLYENDSVTMAAPVPLPNLVGGQVLSLSNNILINLRNDRMSELYRFIDNKLTLLGHEDMVMKSVAQTKVLADG